MAFCIVRLRIITVVEIFVVSDVNLVLRFSLLPVPMAPWERGGVERQDALDVAFNSRPFSASGCPLLFGEEENVLPNKLYSLGQSKRELSKVKRDG